MSIKCEHNDCFTCPYPDCISKLDPEERARKRGRKPLPPEERKKRRQSYNLAYRKKHKSELQAKYIERTEGIVKRRYKKKVAEAEA